MTVKYMLKVGRKNPRTVSKDSAEYWLKPENSSKAPKDWIIYEYPANYTADEARALIESNSLKVRVMLGHSCVSNPPLKEKREFKSLSSFNPEVKKCSINIKAPDITKKELKYLENLGYLESQYGDDVKYFTIPQKDLSTFFALYKNKQSLLFELYPNIKVWKDSIKNSWRIYFNKTHTRYVTSGKRYMYRNGYYYEITDEAEQKKLWMDVSNYYTFLTPTRVIHFPRK